MKEYIDKSALVAEIERRTKEHHSGYLVCLKDILSFLDTLEVKEVQEEPVSEFLNTESMIESYKQKLISQANGIKNSPLIDMCLVSYKDGINETLDTLNLSNIQRTIKNGKVPVSEDLKKASIIYSEIVRNTSVIDEDFIAGAKWKEQQMLNTIQRYVEKGLRCYNDSEGKTQEAYWDGFKDCANSIWRNI